MDRCVATDGKVRNFARNPCFLAKRAHKELRIKASKLVT